MTLRHTIVFVFIIISGFLAPRLLAQENPEEYNKTIQMADSYFSKGDYINAKASYQIAVRLAPNEQYPKDRLQQSLDMIKVQMYQNSQYQQKILIADDLFAKKDYPGALQYYQEALSILPGDVYASGKIQEITRNQANAQQIEADYQKSITAADQLFNEGKLDKALAEYKNAMALKPAETYPKQKALKTEALIAQKANISNEYQTAMQSADLAVSRNNYDEAIKQLEKAINLMPGEPLPKQKLAEAQNMKAAWDSYNSIIQAADDFYVDKDWENAREKYLQAQAIKPADEYPKRMLEKIDIAMMDVEQANRSSYEFTIQKADELFSQQDYEKAMVEYQKALLFKPDEEYAQQRINDINNALVLRKSQEEAYSQAISRADILFREENYSDAKTEYNRAISIKPLEQYPKVKIDEINTILKDLATKQDLYNNLIKGADRLFFSDEYVEAREQYRQASYLFPKQQYPIDQITMINEILGQRDTYVKAVTRADQLFYEKDYEAALMEFRNAAALQPEETYPQEKIREIEALLAEVDQEEEDQRLALEEYNKEKVYEVEADQAAVSEMEAKESEYWAKVESADEAMKLKDYTKALADYEAARKLKPGEVYAQGKIAQINATLADIAKKETEAREALDKQYRDAISAGDLAMQNKEYQKALTAFQQAAGLKPQEAYPQGKITEINTTLSEIAAKQALDKQYGDAISAGDLAMQNKEYQNALTAYQQAASLKPQEAYPQGKITEINTTLSEIAAKQALDKQYGDAISAGDLAMQSKEYQKALTAYQQATSLKPQEAYPQGKISEINSTLGEIAAKEALDKQYGDAISAGDLALQNKEYQKALTAYQQAASLKPQESYPQGKISEINSTLGEIAAKEALDKQYGDAISAGDLALQNKEYQKALTAYQQAASLKPQESYPQGKITEINSTLGEIAAKEALDKQYGDAISAGDLALQSKEYQKALTAYQQAASLKPQEAYPQGKITEINSTLGEIAAKEALDKQYSDAISAGDLALQSKEYQKALTAYQQAASLKPQESYPKGKITEINSTLGEIAAKEALDKQYGDAISAADLALQNKEYQKALTAYQQAASLKPKEAYPQGKITEINTTLSEIAAKEALDKQYGDAISAGDLAMQNKEYQKALTAYQQAANLKPKEAYPQGKITEINSTLGEIAAKEALDKQYGDAISAGDLALQSKEYQKALTAYQQAASLKPQESYPKGKITEINSTLGEIAAKEALDKQYGDAISAADLALQNKEYQKALTAYQQAAGLKPQESYPKGKITEINTTLSEIAAKEALDKQFSAAIATADKTLQSGNYEQALTEYQAALNLKPGEPYAQAKVLEVKTTIAEQAKQLEIQQQYITTISAADEFLKNNKYEEARAAYQQAQALKPGEDYPGKQILQIDHTLSTMAAERETAYQSAVSKADIYLAEKDYEMARAQYARALELKPDDAAVKMKLNQAEEQLAIKKQLIKQEYDKTIIDADKFFTAKTYDNAIESYRAAALLMPEEEYPKTMVTRILKILSERSIVQINKDPLLISNNTTHKFNFIPVPAKDRKSNYIFFTARNISEKEYKLIISYGQDQSKNGGVVVKVPAGANLNEYVVRISAQYKWFSDDNNWISFYPEGGDIEVRLMQISYSD